MEPLFRSAWRHVGGAVLKHQRCGCYNGETLQGRRWYCLSVHPGCDFLAASLLAHQGYLTFVPLFVDRSSRPARAAEPLIEPLFPGYQFIAANRDTDALAPACYVRGVKGFAGAAPTDPRPVTAGLVEALIARAGDDGLIDDAKPLRRDAVPLGAALRIMTGPLAGTQGVCSMSAGDRVKVFLALLNGATVSLSRSAVELA